MTFAKIGLFTFGGGYAMISIIEDTCVKKKHWLCPEDMMNLTIVAEATPGPIAINCATYIGYRQKGFAGAIAATLGVVLPSFAILLLIAAFLDNFLEITIIANAFKGIKLAVGILVADASVKLYKKMRKNAFSRVILLSAAVVMLLINIFAISFSTVILMLTSGAVGFAFFVTKEKCGKVGDKK